MAFTGDDSWYDHVEEVFGPQSGIIRLPQGAVFETRQNRVAVTTFSQVREADRDNRGCQMDGGPHNCRVYRMQGCTGGASCTIEEFASRMDHD